MQLFYNGVSCVGISALLMMEYIVRKNDALAAPNKRFFRLSIWVVIIVMLSEIATILFEGAAARYRIFHVLGNVFGFSLSPFIPLLVGCAIGGSRKTSLILCGIPSVINLILTVFSIWFPFTFWVDAQNTYMRGETFCMFIFSYTIALIYLLFQTLFITGRYQNNNRFIPIVLFFFVVCGTLGQVLIPALHISWLCVSFAVALYYMYYCDLLHQIDGLTGLLNRRAYEYNTRRIKGSDKIAVVLFDIDDFKSVNDLYGHPFGDCCLADVSSCIKKAFFKTGLCFRIGGDEFCVITKKTDKATVEKAYAKFLEEINSMREAESRLPMVSIGYAFADAESKGITDAILKADRNMYQFKWRRKARSKV